MAFYNNKKEKPPEVETTVWACTTNDCTGWMRENFTFEKEPRCPFCNSEMVREVKTLPQIS
ncbi:cold-shock protein [Bacillus piscicola]|uniref:cold-shock protein n=1 Tax=Bacillus piscicola TaxID=1632684 RepID=UPI001F091DB8|nr:cold-shock protein [Bacillus piscicola]